MPRSRRVLWRLIVVCIVAVNAGYTLLLLPLLSLLLPGAVPLTLENLLAFLLVDSLWGVLLAAAIHLLSRAMRVGLARAAAYSIAAAWLAFWAYTLREGRAPLGGVAPRVLAADGLAALVTWLVFTLLAHRYVNSAHPP